MADTTERWFEGPIVDVFCQKCGTHSTILSPTRISERYDYDTGMYYLVDKAECGACGEILTIKRKMKIIELESLIT